MHPSSSLPTGHSKAAAVFRVTAGNFLEMFDFFLFGFYATHIAADFFPGRQRVRLADADLHDSSAPAS